MGNCLHIIPESSKQRTPNHAPSKQNNCPFTPCFLAVMGHSIPYPEGEGLMYRGVGINSGAYVSEIIRAGIQSISIGQTEAGYALGFKYNPRQLRGWVSGCFPQEGEHPSPTVL